MQTPYVHYANVPESAFLFNEDGVLAFIQGLIEINTQTELNKNHHIDIENVYSLFDFLEPYRIPAPILDCGAITGQRGGTCTPACTKVWMRYKTAHLGSTQTNHIPC